MLDIGVFLITISGLICVKGIINILNRMRRYQVPNSVSDFDHAIISSIFLILGMFFLMASYYGIIIGTVITIVFGFIFVFGVVVK